LLVRPSDVVVAPIIEDPPSTDMLHAHETSDHVRSYLAGQAVVVDDVLSTSALGEKCNLLLGVPHRFFDT
jgi:hypothetical protein